MLLSISQRYILKANHNPQMACGKINALLSISQRYILKANHNLLTIVMIALRVVINKSKIHFESKSQPFGRAHKGLSRCYQ